MNQLSIRKSMALCFIAAIATSVTAQETPEQSPPFRFGDFEVQINERNSPAAAAIGDDGSIYIADAIHNRIAVFDRSGQLVREWGSLGDEPGQFRSPQGLAISDDNVFVLDTGGNRVQQFSTDGVFTTLWNGGETDFNSPGGIVATNDRVYIADTGNDRVAIFDHNGNLLGSFGEMGHDDGQFNEPVDLDVDDGGYVYIVDAGNNRIQKFDADGAFIAAWGDWGPFVGLMDRPTGITVRDDRVFVADTNNHRVQVFTTAGEQIYQWGVHALLPREGEGKLHYPADVTIAPDGSFAVVVEPFEDRAQIFAVAPDDVSERDSASPPAPKLTQTHFGRRLDIDGNMLIVAEPELHRVHAFRIDLETPIHVTQFGRRGYQPGLLVQPTGIDVDVDNVQVWIADAATRRLQLFRLKYDPNETLRFVPFISRMVKAWNLNAMESSLPRPIVPQQIRRGPDGNVYVLDSRNAMVHVIGADMKRLRSIGGAENALRQPTDFAFGNEADRIYIVDAGSHNIQVFDLEGHLQNTIGGHVEANGSFVQPFGITILNDGRMLVTDAGADCVHVFHADGDFVEQWGTSGYKDAEFWSPAGIEQAADGRVFILDYGNHRGQIWSPEGEWLVTFGLGRPSTRSNPKNYK